MNRTFVYPAALIPLPLSPFLSHPIASQPVLGSCFHHIKIFFLSSNLLVFFHFSFCIIPSYFILSHPILLLLRYYSIPSIPYPVPLSIFYPILSLPIPPTVILCPVQSHPILPHPSLVSYPSLAYAILFLCTNSSTISCLNKTFTILS